MKKQFLQNIISESDRLNRLIDKILDLEKFETGKQKIYPAKNNLIQTIDKTIEPLQQLIKNKHITLYIENNKNIHAFYDEDRIVQVITNLISNAIKFCPDFEGLITIQIIEKDEYILTSIQDNGKGINPNDFEIIFDKFYQSNNQNIKKPVGSGLGLAICKQIIEHHKGKIWAENAVNGGACFYFTLPKMNIKTKRSMKKILIVDDEPNIIMSLEYTFKKSNFEVFIARDGQEALDILQNETPDAIILDVMMPNVDGYATITEIKKDEKLQHCKIVFLSAKNKESDIEKGLGLGANAYMTKPFSIKKLVDKINELVEE